MLYKPKLHKTKHLFYTTSDSAWDGLLKSMHSVKESIYIEMYIFVDDVEKCHKFISLLSEKAQSGVRVRMVLDAFGSFSLSNKARQTLREAGVELLFFSKWFRRLHKKVIIVDSKTGFLGGVNIHNTARWWDDLLVRVEGPIVKSLIRTFKRTYKICGGIDEEILRYNKKAVLGRTRIWLLEHVPFIRQPRLKDAYVESFDRAEHTILLVTPYLLPHKWLIKLIEVNLARGKEIHIVVPKKTDLTFITQANNYYADKLSRMGVMVFQTHKMNHAKVLLIDETLAFVGSNNIDALSFDFNSEAGIFFTDKAMIVDIKKIIMKWKHDSTLVSHHTNFNWYEKIISLFVRMLQPFL